MKEQLEVTDLKGNKIGIMNVEVAPCDEKGREYTEADDKFVDSPDDLVGTKDLIVAGKHNGLSYILNYFKNLISTFIRPSWQWKNHVIS